MVNMPSGFGIGTDRRCSIISVECLSLLVNVLRGTTMRSIASLWSRVGWYPRLTGGERERERDARGGASGSHGVGHLVVDGSPEVLVVPTRGDEARGVIVLGLPKGILVN